MVEMREIKEILTTGAGTEGQLLIPRKIYDTLIEEVNKNLIGRDLAAIYIGPGSIPGSSVDVDTVDKDSMNVYKVAEGAAVPLDTAAYSSTNLKPVKYGVRPVITKEMLEDGKWNLLEHNIKYAGKKLAENETSLILTALQGCTNNVSGGAAITIANITYAMQYLHDKDYTSTHLLIGPEVLYDMQNIDTFAEVNKRGDDAYNRTGWVGTIYGMKVILFSTTAAPSTTYSKYAYVIDKENSFMIAEKRPVTVERYDDKTHDISGAVITQRIVVSRLRDYATCRISTS